jgi:Na+-translocating ferredoxin:NAD+ oxidoreductase subunit B
VTPAEQSLADQIDAALPQTQCTRCGEPDCRRYAEAIAMGRAPINRCPPGGQEGVRRIALITQQPELALDPSFGIEAERAVAVIDESWCIGCTLCIKACPVDAIFGAPKAMHAVLMADCTGCELCIPACPVDCIRMETVTPGQTGWSNWPPEQARAARQRYDARNTRLTREALEQTARLEAKAAHKLAHLDDLTHHAGDEAEKLRKRAVIEAAMQRARAKAAAK